MSIKPEIVKEAKIIVQVNRKQVAELNSLNELKAWLLDNLMVAYVVGYPNPQKVEYKKEAKQAGLSVKYITSLSSGQNDFDNLKELKKWLDNHLLIANALDYQKRKATKQ